jgi:hypothetical protein
LPASICGRRTTLDDAAIDRMLRLKQALDEGNYDEEFDKLFPRDEDGGSTG